LREGTAYHKRRTKTNAPAAAERGARGTSFKTLICKTLMAMTPGRSGRGALKRAF